MARVNVSNDDQNFKQNSKNKTLEKEIQKVLDKITDEIDGKAPAKTEKCVWQSTEKMATTIKNRFSEAETNRKEIEQRWLKDLRQYRGQYDPEVLNRIHPNRSRAYIRITRTKVKTVDSRLVELLFPPNDDSNWSIKPTVLPALDEASMNTIIMNLQQSGAQQVTREMLDAAVDQYAKDRAKSMEKSINDQLSQMAYRDTLRQVIHSGNMYGTGILKGPLVMLSKSRQYKQVEGKSGATSWKLESTDQLLPYIEHVPVWDFYPDMTSERIDDCRYIIQRHKMNKKQLLDLSKREDFMSDKITEYVEHQMEGDWEDKFFDAQLKEIGERSNSKGVDKKGGRKYEILEYWGYLDTADLETMGAEVPEDLKGEVEVAANVWVLGDKVIKAAVSHLGEIQWPFFLYYYDKDETGIFGEGIPTILRDIQDLVNSAFRAMLDNAAITAGPQFEVNLDLLAEDEDPTDIHPLKVWLRTGEGLDASQEAVKIKNITSHTPEFLQMCQAFEKYADEVTTIPQYMWGEATPGIGRTASGMSMLMGSANITIKDQVKNFDDGITRPFIQAMYHWNMKFNSNSDIKGDYDIRAEGTASLIAKEVYSQALMQFATITNNPVYQTMVRNDAILREIANSLDLSDKNLIMSAQEIQANQQVANQQQQAERDFMLRMTEVARKSGTSPVEMIESMRQLYTDKQNMMQQVPNGSNN